MIHIITTYLSVAIAVFVFATLFFAGCLCRAAGSKRDSGESAIQERGGLFAWAVFHALAVWASISWWLRVKRVCAWHNPKPKRMGGNPLARQVTHGLCPECFARVSGEIASHEPELRSKAA